MARTRNVKPGLFTNDLLAECDPLARLLFIGLWCHADRNGVLEYRPRKIRAEVLPFDDGADVDRLAGQLEDRGFLRRFHRDGATWVQVANFHRHQTPHHAEPAIEWADCPNPQESPPGSDFRGCPENSGHNPDESGHRPENSGHDPNCFPIHVGQVQTEIKSSSDESNLSYLLPSAFCLPPSSSSLPPSASSGASPPSGGIAQGEQQKQQHYRWVLGKGWEGITAEDRRQWREAFPAVDADRQLLAMGLWLEARPVEAAVKEKRGDWAKFVVGWLGNEAGKVAKRAVRAGGGLLGERAVPAKPWSPSELAALARARAAQPGGGG
ncbi:hypothetical protein UFOVP1124_39 [uncultured Caudovirales phage]|uniref:Uncharacterized protein n=1 Tax=uncultured Caudovirales phage TaxID=2100421 RepID=A0A6J5QZA5_9CAUD|nr:hypothetical protein UFOVP1124_39 [uncultured Caudovirales phage]